MLVGEDDQVVELFKVRVERLPEALLELVGLAARFRLRLDQRLDREDVELDLLRRRPSPRASRRC